MDGSSRPMDPGASQREEKATGQQMLLLFGRTAFFNGYLIYVYSRAYSTTIYQQRNRFFFFRITGGLPVDT
jgi:hypothetical protein